MGSDGLNILYVDESDAGVSTIMTIPATGGTPQPIAQGYYPAARPAALPTHLAGPIGNALGSPQGYVYTERVPSYQHQ